MKKKDYSYSVCDYKDAVQISDKKKEEAAKKIFDTLKKSRKKPFEYWATGDAVVIGVQHEDGEILIWEVSGNQTIQHNYVPLNLKKS